jgi:hypothetical protein
MRFLVLPARPRRPSKRSSHIPSRRPILPEDLRRNRSPVRPSADSSPEKSLERAPPDILFKERDSASRDSVSIRRFKRLPRIRFACRLPVRTLIITLLPAKSNLRLKNRTKAPA